MELPTREVRIRLTLAERHSPPASTPVASCVLTAATFSQFLDALSTRPTMRHLVDLSKQPRT